MHAQPKISDFTLHIKELKIFKGSLNFVIGKLGSGKSALLQVLLNEMDQVRIKKSRALIRGTLAYVS